MDHLSHVTRLLPYRDFFCATFYVHMRIEIYAVENLGNYFKGTKEVLCTPNF